ncbi:hypothetical protein [Burkholderia pseudomallei]|uniref:hypothetical protein n=1 Tax=Burkholderia pseudomallei TaxID=28450 RepID=UPI000F06652B|nr:hypothetical protein [Burkholderia pseudomallei]
MDDFQDMAPLQLGVSPAMERAAAALCNLKIEMDRYARGFIGQPYLDDWMGAHGTCAYWGDELLRLAVPFLDWERGVGERFKALVDPRHVLGASIKGLPEHIPEKDVPERIARYAKTLGSSDHVLYFWYKPLGILTAHEGKHRVAFMRAHDQPAIAAWVCEASYPAAERITVIAPNDERDDWLAMLDGRYVQVLRRPRVSLLLLQAYGVKVRRWRDLPDMPNEARVRRAINERKLHRNPKTIAEADRTLDLETVRQRAREDAEPVIRTIHDLEHHRFEWRRYGAVLAGCLAIAMVLSFVDYPLTRSAGMLLMGIATGLAWSLSLIRFVGRRGS